MISTEELLIRIEELLIRAERAERLSTAYPAVRAPLLAYAADMRAQAEQIVQEQGETIQPTDDLGSPQRIPEYRQYHRETTDKDDDPGPHRLSGMNASRARRG